MSEPLNGNELLALFEALSNPHRLRIISLLVDGRKYVSQLARAAELSRPLLYMHLKKLEKARIVETEMEVSDDGKALKYYTLVPFDFYLTPDVIREAVKTLTIERKGKKNE